MPAAAMITRTPRSAAVDAYSATARGSRCADRTWNSYEMPRSSSSCIAGSIRSRSDSEPTRMPTSGARSPNSISCANASLCVSGCNLCRPRADVAPVLHSVERDQPARFVRGFARLVERRPERRYVEDAAAIRHERAAVNCRAGLEDDRLLLGFGDAVDPGSGVSSFRIVASGEDDRERRVVLDAQRVVREMAGGAEGVVQRALVGADEDALAGGEAVDLDDARRARDGEGLRGPDADRAHHVFRERLRALDPCRAAAWPEDRDPAVP